ncbi:MAG: class I SAM-dependent methyltransferase [Planctomycetota bacterium]
MSVQETFSYIGDELDTFSHAVNWKAYFRSRFAPLLRGRVLEVGAGIGGTTQVLCDGEQTEWVALEPDGGLAERMREEVQGGAFPVPVDVREGTLSEIDTAESFDAILYIDVLEHIEDDAGELARVAERLRPGGCAIVLCPAHQFLFTPFDEAIGHFRRYNRSMYRAITPASLVLERCEYLDAAGMLLSLGNRLLLKSSEPKVSQVKLWDRVFVPISRVLDPLCGRTLGKSVLGVWRKPAENER